MNLLARLLVQQAIPESSGTDSLPITRGLIFEFRCTR